MDVTSSSILGGGGFHAITTFATLTNLREPRHEEIKAFYPDFRKQKGTVYTTDYVLDETLTLLFRSLPFPHARRSIETLDEAIQEGYLQLEWITPERFAQATGQAADILHGSYFHGGHERA